MKIIVLIAILLMVICLFKYFSKKNKKVSKESINIVDLEKDPKTNEYKPKDK